MQPTGGDGGRWGEVALPIQRGLYVPCHCALLENRSDWLPGLGAVASRTPRAQL